jgi:tetratricopeptide (TPR) repeat protein
MNDTQLAQGDPAARHLLAALGGSKDSLSWLDHHKKGLSVFARALTNGGSKGLEGLKALDPAAWDELFDTVCNDGLEQALQDRHPDVYLLFEAVKGDEEALAQLKRKKRSYGKLVEVIREAHEKYLLSSSEEVGKDCIPSSAAADVGCLIGELHLSKGEYHKAIEAFSRAIENQPTADVYEGRARAYRALAEQDEHKAVSMKQT